MATWCLKYFLIFSLIYNPFIGDQVFSQTSEGEDKDLIRRHYLEQRAILPPDDVQGHLDLGFFCSENGLYKEAIRQFKKVLTMSGISLKSKQNVVQLIRVTEENAAVTLYNKAIEAWADDRNFVVARSKLEELVADYPTAKIVSQAKEKLMELNDQETLQKEIEEVEETLAKVETENFVVFSPEKKLSLALAQKAEAKRREIIQRLGFSIFPSWEKVKARIRIYPNRETFLKYVPLAEWSGGWTQQTLQENTKGEKEIVSRSVSTYVGGYELQDSVIPHEVAHLVFREFFGFSSNLPKWLDEGVAVWMEDKLHLEVGLFTQPRHLRENYLPFREFLTLNVYPENPVLFYAQAYSVTTYLLKTHGRKVFIEFIKELSLDHPLQQALNVAYPNQYLDIEDLEHAWASQL